MQSVIQLSLGIVFLGAFVSKIRNLPGFLEGIQRYELLPLRVVPLFGWTVVIGEGGLTVAHLTGIYLKAVASLGVALLFMFLVAVSVTLVRGTAVPCHCFGETVQTVSWRSVGRLIFMIFGELVIVFGPNSPRAPFDPSSIQSMMIITILAALMIHASMWILRVDQIIPLIWNVPRQLYARHLFRKRAKR